MIRSAWSHLARRVKIDSSGSDLGFFETELGLSFHSCDDLAIIHSCSDPVCVDWDSHSAHSDSV